MMKTCLFSYLCILYKDLNTEVHNHRTKRLWRDVCLHVLQHFTVWRLNPGNDIHRLSLHTVICLRFKRLEHFRPAWNRHGLQTENNRTPTQLWTEGMLTNTETQLSTMCFGNIPTAAKTLRLSQLNMASRWRLPSCVRRATSTREQQASVLNAIHHISNIKYQAC